MTDIPDDVLDKVELARTICFAWGHCAAAANSRAPSVLVTRTAYSTTGRGAAPGQFSPVSARKGGSDVLPRMP